MKIIVIVEIEGRYSILWRVIKKLCVVYPLFNDYRRCDRLLFQIKSKSFFVAGDIPISVCVTHRSCIN